VDVFDDRLDAGRQLAYLLERFRGQDAVVLGLPRGGVPVADQVARSLGLPLDIIVVRKLGVPWQPELAMGAIGEGGVRVINDEIASAVPPEQLARVEQSEQQILEQRAATFRQGRERVDLSGRIAIVVDDGLATGSTARAACRVARLLGASEVVLAVPVAAPDSVERMTEADEVIAVAMPSPFLAVGYHYRVFGQTSDDEVIALLAR
jgi:putative phosphoribosyl transferase